MKITLLLHNAYAAGPALRGTLALAAALADRHDVELVSMLRHREVPRCAVDPRLRLVPLVDTRIGSDDMAHPLFGEPAPDVPRAEGQHHQYSRLVELRAAEFLRGTDADVLVGTRTGVNVQLARFGPRRALRIAQEPLRYDVCEAALGAELAGPYRALDALVAPEEAAAARWRARLPLPGVRVLALPPVVPAVPAPPTVPETSAPTDPASAPAGLAPAPDTGDGDGDGDGRQTIAAAGRLVPGERFDLLVEAFSAVCAKHPGWRLRIHGEGPERARLHSLIDGLGLGGRAELGGPRTPDGAEFAGASIAASASETGTSGPALVEAMRRGVPVVGTGRPPGPTELIRAGGGGVLVPCDDGRALAGALLDLAGDPAGRRAMGAAARESARRHGPGPVAERYLRLFEELRATRRSRAVRRTLGLAGHRVRTLARGHARA
ncbi:MULTISPECIES: glycosyltransferase [unclassified Streptomyces]|uniref:glycosyltransferase n=1 Tax=unclassified Streptomyces TaxID=2593676 RepID=UPI00037839D5|nr:MULTISPECIES: glycosyltransferase [unclassified Streptomyces]MYT28470.1 glycosyltransferase [Streptomyces sp. SID8354]